MNVLEVRNLKKFFGSVKAVDDVSFGVPEGSIFGLIGRNGAGKTTTIRMIMDIYQPDEGQVFLHGEPAGPDFKSQVGYLPEERGLYKKMKVLDTLLYFAELKGKRGKAVSRKANEYLERFELLDRRQAKVEDLSKGNQQKIQFITTILHDPEMLILDEPFSGLDPINTNLLKEIILEKKREGRVILFSTHLMDFAEKMCDHVAMIDQGKIILNGALDEIKAGYGQRNISLHYQGDISFLHDHPLVEKIMDYGNSTGIRVHHPGQTQELLRLLLDRAVVIKKFDANEISLQEIFIELAGRDEPSARQEEVSHV